jgi:hypothetical protein
MFRTAALVSLPIAFVSSLIVRAQTFPPATLRSFGELQAQIGRSDAGESQQVHLQWFTAPSALRDPVAPDDVRILERRRGGGPLPRERDPQLSAEHLVVISSDAAGRELDWRIVPDPRLIRAEVPDEQGRLSGRLLQRSQADLLVDVPDLPQIARLRVYAAEWDGSAFVLHLLLTADLP